MAPKSLTLQCIHLVSSMPLECERTMYIWEYDVTLYGKKDSAGIIKVDLELIKRETISSGSELLTRDL